MYRDKYQRRRERGRTPALGTPALEGDLGTASPEVLTHRREARMREAVRTGEFEVYFQPIIDVLTHRIDGAEALLRWRDPDRGLLLPQSFLGLAEDTGLIVPLGEMVLRTSCQAVVAWRTSPRAARAACPSMSQTCSCASVGSCRRWPRSSRKRRAQPRR